MQFTMGYVKQISQGKVGTGLLVLRKCIIAVDATQTEVPQIPLFVSFLPWIHSYLVKGFMVGINH